MIRFQPDCNAEWKDQSSGSTGKLDKDAMATTWQGEESQYWHSFPERKTSSAFRLPEQPKYPRWYGAPHSVNPPVQGQLNYKNLLIDFKNLKLVSTP